MVVSLLPITEIKDNIIEPTDTSDKLYYYYNAYLKYYIRHLLHDKDSLYITLMSIIRGDIVLDPYKLLSSLLRYLRVCYSFKFIYKSNSPQ